ncbi:precorrin-6Y C5,15-methyltransferase (decarboxylating) [Rhodobium orientis]|uniref:Bifunctional cobalt-precorrin-7 (C(5))-methyltransferase/cobalt-precorrin-6B (C(15))-methyltransferase n=1 Tax=Rhodobium orientis TaxID=34017 RepID=A0A327JNN4_9HYPH|nr:precorrin-6y C5,15-methyltransferase (decarboxylating) subunit CbiE [Rhodobium orientis]MBB4304697.1 precorrin-6Y C5,15-methyltransferase (decarboxylating) [Rhodobium orientis]MBK5952098.1 bifunctional cobalt-precorrin-7 (C(5))-methyltransferase/cobalt-precorrin-6B (C(15))-methyltransferase [Rhodobium orientis]RAI26502.1 bifunctional cobalt-precorrin-7 (C(5))-methyltransferase/cobalt-precorrin-6B (C(15))-methyltransferase [Rhodobium orientis]
MTERWLSIVGIGEDGVEGLSPAAKKLIEDAELVAGGARHLGLAGTLISCERLSWPSPYTDAIPHLVGRRGRPVCVLASGDPFFYGVGAKLTAFVAPEEMRIVPAPSSLSLAAAKLGWSLADVRTISFCGRPLAPLAPLLQPGARILALSADAATPAEVADFLSRRGFGESRIHVLESLGGPEERIRSTTAWDFAFDDVGALNLTALEIVAGPDAVILPRTAGLPDGLFENDGQMTKREVRAVTLSTLAPHSGELLWDIGAGSGSIAIEWLLADPANRAIGIERDEVRAARAARNAVDLGVPDLDIREGSAPEAFAGLEAPDAVFIGGGITSEGVLDGAYSALKRGGRIVANSITVESEAVLIDAVQRYGGTLARLSVERLDAIGGMHGFRPAMTVTQWSAVKP